MPSFKKVSTGGAPEIINDEIIDRVCNAMRAGAYIETAAAIAGIGKSTLHNWLKKGNQNPDSIYGRFLSAVEQAMHECVMRDLLNIDKCAMGKEVEFVYDENGTLVLDEKGRPIVKSPAIAPDWSASAWRLERRHARQWSKVETVNTNPIDSRNEKTVEELEKELAEIDRKLKMLDE